MPTKAKIFSTASLITKIKRAGKGNIAAARKS
jgi:hypothetical protein